MYAVIETGGKQYRVEVGTELEVELLDGDPGDSLKIERVLLVADGDTAEIGRPVVTNASVAAEIVRRDRGPKLINFKYGPKTRRRIKKGHRQELTILRISDIVLDGKSAAADVAKEEAARKADRRRLEEAAKRQAAADAELAAKLAADKAAAEPAAPKAKAKAAKPKTEAAVTTKGAATKSTAAKKTTAKAAPAKAKADTKTTSTKSATAPKKAPAKRSTKKDA